MKNIIEIKWSLFFDILGWDYDYKSKNLNGHISTFILNFEKPILVIIKSEINEIEIINFIDLVKKSGWENEFLILGSSPKFYNNFIIGGLSIKLGMLYDKIWNQERTDCILSGCASCNGLTFISDTGSFQCRKCGDYDGDHLLCDCGYNTKDIKEMWDNVSNKINSLNLLNFHKKSLNENI